MRHIATVCEMNDGKGKFTVISFVQTDYHTLHTVSFACHLMTDQPAWIISAAAQWKEDLAWGLKEVGVLGFT